jgi:protein-S-isoprenylcysteine O-methyltransferase Ste14
MIELNDLTAHLFSLWGALTQAKRSTDLRRSRIAAIASSVAVYLPILAGLIEPMIWPLLIASPVLYHLLYWWWLPLQEYFAPQWFFITSYLSDTGWMSVFAPFLIGAGAVLLVGGFGQILLARTRKNKLVTAGLYGYVRHPQHLGIALLSLGLLMTSTLGLRIGDIYAWSVVVFIYILLADHEEERLRERFGEEYARYMEDVPFMVPFVPSMHQRVPKILPQHGWRRKLALLAMYLVILTWASWILMTLPRFHLR